MRDPGLQPERTALAWSRTGLLLAANAALFLRGSQQANDATLLVLGVLLMAAAVWLALVARWRGRELASHRPARAQVGHLAAVSVATCVAAAGGVWLFIWQPLFQAPAATQVAPAFTFTFPHS